MKLNMIEVFKTNVHKASQAKKLVGSLREHFPGRKINVDMHDCDKVLRIEGEDFIYEKVMMIVESGGFKCTLLE
jgi:hypothetical protein